MKNIKTFEVFAFGYDDKAIKLYVDYLLSSDDFIDLFDTIGLDVPTDLSGDEYHSVMDDARKLAFVYFTNHPTEIDVNKMKKALSEK